MASIFSKIVKGEIPSYKVAEAEYYYAFLDINPLQKGHTLVIPKKETDYLFDLSDEELAGLMVLPRRSPGLLVKPFLANGSVWLYWVWMSRMHMFIWCLSTEGTI